MPPRKGLRYLLSGMGLAGNLLVVINHTLPALFIWTASNFGWIVVILKSGELKEQLPLWIGYTMINVGGIILAFET
jgi:hypothetical protein